MSLESAPSKKPLCTANKQLCNREAEFRMTADIKAAMADDGTYSHSTQQSQLETRNMQNFSINDVQPSTSTTTTTMSTTNCSINNDPFVSRLIEAVRQQPCLYNPNHEHYGNKQQSAQFRSAVWKKLCKELDFKGIIW